MLGAPAGAARRPRRRRRARDHPAGLGGRGRAAVEASGARARHRLTRPGRRPARHRRAGAARGAERRARGASRRHRHPPRGARRPAEGPADRHRRAHRRRPAGAPAAFRVRYKRGRVISAASPTTRCHRPTARSSGIAQGRRGRPPALAASPADLAGLAAAPPADWQQELGRKAAMWRFGLWRAAQRAEGAARRRRTTSRRPRRRSRTTRTADEAELRRPRGRGALRRGRGLAARPRVRRRRATSPRCCWSASCARARTSGSATCGGCSGRAPLSPAAIEWAEERIGGYDEDQVLLRSAVKSSDGFFTTFFVSPYSRYIARWCAHRGFTPNQVTTVSVLIGALAAAAFATGERWGLVAAPSCSRSRSPPTAWTASWPATRARSRSWARGWTRSSTARRSTWRSRGWRSAPRGWATATCGCSPAP